MSKGRTADVSICWYFPILVYHDAVVSETMKLPEAAFFVSLVDSLDGGGGGEDGGVVDARGGGADGSAP